MLENWAVPQKPEREEIKLRLRTAKERLSKQQMCLKEHGLPVLVLMEGWGAAGKGSLIGKIIKNIDPRFFKVATMENIGDQEDRYPFLHRYFVQIPEAGKFTFLDSGWMNEICMGRARKEFDSKEYAKKVESVQRFERQLVDNGYLVMKFFCHISREEQKKRMDKLSEKKDTRWRVSEEDVWQNKHYKRCLKIFDNYLRDADSPVSPWYLVDASCEKWAQLQILEALCRGIEIAMENRKRAVLIPQNVFSLKKMPQLSEVGLGKKVLSESDYRRQLKPLQERLRALHNRLYRKQVPVVICYEGWDAAGKGGNIKRITEALDPRGFEVHPIASPEPHEKARHYLWRFWTRLPKTGHIAIFDRTWYGRVMVERLEGFCSENDWQRAYNEINEFERELFDWGAVILKFWVQIDKETQLERFQARQNTPEKRWKITEEDWRNREKWDAYENAVNEMLEKTSTQYAPWYILESVDKKYARIQALKIVIEELERVLE